MREHVLDDEQDFLLHAGTMNSELASAMRRGIVERRSALGMNPEPRELSPTMQKRYEEVKAKSLAAMKGRR